MKGLSLVIASFCIFFLLLILACADPDEGVVTLDGPILESINQEGAIEFNGSIVNNGDSPVKSVFVLITLVGSDGNIVGANSVHVGEEEIDNILFPGERSHFAITFDSVPSEVVTKNVEIFFDMAKEF